MDGHRPRHLEKLEIAAPLEPAQNIRIDRMTSISEPELLWKIVTNRPSRLAHYVLSRFRGTWDRACHGPVGVRS
jgi:hypothetical protein